MAHFQGAALLFHFASEYVGRKDRLAVIGIWSATGILLLLVVLGVFYRIEGVHSYAWGNMFRVVPSFMDPGIFVLWFGINLSACWLVYKAARSGRSLLEQRHRRYVLAGMLAVTFAVVKALVTIGVDAGVVLPLGMLLGGEDPPGPVTVGPGRNGRAISVRRDDKSQLGELRLGRTGAGPEHRARLCPRRISGFSKRSTYA